MHESYGTYGKEKTNKVLSNLDIDPRDTIKLAKAESLLSVEAHISLTRGIEQTRLPVEVIVSTIPGRWRFIDASWKNQDVYSGQRWYTTLEGFDGLMGAMNTKKTSHSPFHSEIEAIIWAMECMRNLRQFTVKFVTDCSQLIKMVSEAEVGVDVRVPFRVRVEYFGFSGISV